MAVGYGYVRDDKPMQIDWADIGKKMSDNIQKELTGREERKADIDKQLAEYETKLLDLPQGQNAEANRFYSDLTSDASDLMRRAARELKTNKLSERDFYKLRANANQGVDLAFLAGKKFNENYDKAMTRYANQVSQSFEPWLRSQTEGFLAFQQNAGWFNPQTGEFNVSRRYKDERTGEWKISTEPGDVANASQLVQQATAQFNKYDVDSAINNAVKGLGATLIQESDGRSVKQFYQAIQDGTAGEESQKLLDAAKTDLAESLTANPYNITSILTENLNRTPGADGKAYEFTYDPEKAAKNKHLILVNPDNSINFDTKNGKEQVKSAQDYITRQLEASLGGERKEVQPSDRNMTDSERKSFKRRREKMGYLKSINTFLSGDQTASQTSLNAMIERANVYNAKNKLPVLVDVQRSYDPDSKRSMVEVTRKTQDGTDTKSYDVTDAAQASEVLYAIFYPGEQDSYSQALQDFNKQEGGFTSPYLYKPNPAYNPNVVGADGMPLEPPYIQEDNPNWQGQNTVGPTKGKSTIDIDFNTATYVDPKTTRETAVSDIIKKVSLEWFAKDGDIKRAKAMKEGADKAFSTLGPEFDIRTKATTEGLKIWAPDLFKGELLLSSEGGITGTSETELKEDYIAAIEQLFNAAAQNRTFDKSIFDKKKRK